MKGALATSEDRLGAYLVLPVVASFVASTVAYGTYSALAAVRPDVATLLRAAQVTFGLYVLIAIVEWSLAISILRRLRRAVGVRLPPGALRLIGPLEGRSSCAGGERSG